MRRANERKHSANIEDIIDDNRDVIDESEIIFLMAPGINRGVFLNRDGHLSYLKDKVRSLGMSVPKANYTEGMKVYQILTQVELLIKNY